MMPDNELSSKPVRASILYPNRFLLASLTEDYEMGGLDIQDPSKGVNFQPWFGYWRAEDNAICVRPAIDGEDIVLFYEENIFEFSFAFDQNMRWCAATQRTDGSFRFRWYDSLVEQYVITEVTGIEGFKVTQDDKRDVLVQIGRSDVLLTYIKNRKLYVRNQRERFQTEHLLAEGLPKNIRITNFGMNERYRMQWRIRYRRPWELMPWLL